MRCEVLIVIESHGVDAGIPKLIELYGEEDGPSSRDDSRRVPGFSLLGVERRDLLRRTAIGGNPLQAFSRAKDDRVVFIPYSKGPSTAIDLFEHRHRVAAGQRDFLELACVREEPDPLAVW